MSDSRLVERIRASNVITETKRFSKHYFYKSSIKFIFLFRNKVDRVTEVENRCCWCLLLLDDTKLIAKILHIGRGKFKILDDEYGGKFVNETIDASDILSCNLGIKPESERVVNIIENNSTINR